MKKVCWFCSITALILLCVTWALAHPHLLKTVSTKLPGGAEVTLDYITVPANEAHLKQAAVGEFLTTRRAPKLKISAEIKTGSVTIPAGEYSVGVIKDSDKDWTVALYPGQLGMDEKPDKAKLIRLDSMSSTTMGTAEHMLIDISPGSGKFEGKAVLLWHFGSQYLVGALS